MACSMDIIYSMVVVVRILPNVETAGHTIAHEYTCWHSDDMLLVVVAALFLQFLFFFCVCDASIMKLKCPVPFRS